MNPLRRLADVLRGRAILADAAGQHADATGEPQRAAGLRSLASLFREEATGIDAAIDEAARELRAMAATRVAVRAPPVLIGESNGLEEAASYLEEKE